MSSASPEELKPNLDPRPLPPKEPELEDCCGTGCVNCVFDMYEIARDNYQRALAAWLARHPDAVA